MGKIYFKVYRERLLDEAMFALVHRAVTKAMAPFSQSKYDYRLTVKIDGYSYICASERKESLWRDYEEAINDCSATYEAGKIASVIRSENETSFGEPHRITVEAVSLPGYIESSHEDYDEDGYRRKSFHSQERSEELEDYFDYILQLTLAGSDAFADVSGGNRSKIGERNRMRRYFSQFFDL